MVFLAAAAQVTKRARLVTGAVLPAFNNPLKLAGELAMLDALCDGRLDIGFARAFLPHEFARFGVKLDESRARFDEGMEQVRLLLEQENVTPRGALPQFPRTVTSLPRPTQRPRPPFYVAALATKESFERAGAAGHGIMAIPMAGGAMAELIDIYRDAWRRAGHPGKRRCDAGVPHVLPSGPDQAERHRARAAEPLSALTGRSRIRLDVGRKLRRLSRLRQDHRHAVARDFDTQVDKGAAWVGTPERILDTVASYRGRSAISKSPRCR